jgi:hypothetical protein
MSNDTDYSFEHLLLRAMNELLKHRPISDSQTPYSQHYDDDYPNYSTHAQNILNEFSKLNPFKAAIPYKLNQITLSKNPVVNLDKLHKYLDAVGKGKRVYRDKKILLKAIKNHVKIHVESNDVAITDHLDAYSGFFVTSKRWYRAAIDLIDDCQEIGLGSEFKYEQKLKQRNSKLQNAYDRLVDNEKDYARKETILKEMNRNQRMLMKEFLQHLALLP